MNIKILRDFFGEESHFQAPDLSIFQISMITITEKLEDLIFIIKCHHLCRFFSSPAFGSSFFFFGEEMKRVSPLIFYGWDDHPKDKETR